MDEQTPESPVRKPYLVIISSHARERWIERVADWKRYEHLGKCQGCGTCVNLVHDIRTAIQIGARYIDRAIVARFREALEAGAKVVDVNFLDGLEYKEVVESHTSKCSFLDLEPIKHHDKYVGRRVKRGLFKSAEGILVNADVNGAANIGRKVTASDRLTVEQIKGIVAYPVRMRIA